MTMTEAPAATLEYRAVDVTKRFSGIPALSGVSVRLARGEIVGLIGHNGAGKSTLLKILSGAYRRDEGELLIDGQEISLSSPAEALAHGVATVYQELSLLPNLSVRENVWLGREIGGPAGLRKAEMRTRTLRLLERFGLRIDPEALVGTLPVATRQLLEIAIAISKNARYLLLDEPTTSLEGEQVGQLLASLKELVAREGVGIMIVDHKLDELYQVCDRIVALVDGRVRIDADVNRVPHAELVQAIVGDDSEEGDVEQHRHRGTVDAETSAQPRESILAVKALRGPSLRGVDLEGAAGEIIGLYGLIGAGRTEFLRTLIGVEPMTAGSIIFEGVPYAPHTPASAMRKGIVYLTEERKVDGIVPGMNSVENLSLPILGRYSRGGVLRRRGLSRDAMALLQRLRIRGDVTGPVAALSGGNQQKVLLARAIAQRPRLLLLDEPTKGVDIGVKNEIHQILKRMAQQEGLLLVVASSEEEEILELADAVTVFADGKTVASGIPAASLTAAKLRNIAWGRH